MVPTLAYQALPDVLEVPVFDQESRLLYLVSFQDIWALCAKPATTQFKIRFPQRTKIPPF